MLPNRPVETVGRAPHSAAWARPEFVRAAINRAFPRSGAHHRGRSLLADRAVVTVFATRDASPRSENVAPRDSARPG